MLYFHKTDLKYNDNSKWLLSLTSIFESELKLWYKNYLKELCQSGILRTSLKVDTNRNMDKQMEIQRKVDKLPLYPRIIIWQLSISHNQICCGHESCDSKEFSTIKWKRGWCIRSPLVTKLFEVVLLSEDVTQRDLKNSSSWCTCDLSLHQVSAMSVHYFWRYEHFSERQRHFFALRFHSYLWSGCRAQSTCYYNKTHFYY